MSFDGTLNTGHPGRDIIDQVAAAHRLTRADLIGSSKKARLVAARWEAIRRIRSELGYSLPKIGRLFGMDHTSVLYATGHRSPSQIASGRKRLEKAAPTDPDVIAWEKLGEVRVSPEQIPPFYAERSNG